MWKSDGWKDYELIDTSDGQRLERWGKYVLLRPDPQVLWNGVKRSPLWKKYDAKYTRSKSGGGHWEQNSLPSEWKISYEPLGLKFIVSPSGFKHTGVFPEQAANWEWMHGRIKNSGRQIKALNLFAYTGGATVAAAAAGAQVCHVDASKGMVSVAKRNAEASGLGDAPIRYIVDDCKKFCEREQRRGNRYDAIIMDPPSYGRGPSGELWKLEDSVYELIVLAASLLSSDPLMFVVNSYTTGLSPSCMAYMVSDVIVPSFGGSVEAGELGLKVSETGCYLPCGGCARWSRK